MKLICIVILLASILQVFNDFYVPQKASAILGDDFFEDFEGSVFPSWTATGLWHIEALDFSGNLGFYW